jgi:hypothetical protein
LIGNPQRQFLRLGEDISKGFLELSTPQLRSVAGINKFHVLRDIYIIRQFGQTLEIGTPSLVRHREL